MLPKIERSQNGILSVSKLQILVCFSMGYHHQESRFALWILRGKIFPTALKLKVPIGRLLGPICALIFWTFLFKFHSWIHMGGPSSRESLDSEFEVFTDKFPDLPSKLVRTVLNWPFFGIFATRTAHKFLQNFVLVLFLFFLCAFLTEPHFAVAIKREKVLREPALYRSDRENDITPADVYSGTFRSNFFSTFRFCLSIWNIVLLSQRLSTIRRLSAKLMREWKLTFVRCLVSVRRLHSSLRVLPVVGHHHSPLPELLRAIVASPFFNGLQGQSAVVFPDRSGIRQVLFCSRGCLPNWSSQ